LNVARDGREFVSLYFSSEKREATPIYCRWGRIHSTPKSVSARAKKENRHRVIYAEPIYSHRSGGMKADTHLLPIFLRMAGSMIIG
jgi:hypothetical protein